MAKKPNLFIIPVTREVPSYNNIKSGNLSIGPEGLEVDGKKTSNFTSLDDLTDVKHILGSGASGSVRKVIHQQTGAVYALKTMLIENSHEFLEKRLVELKALHHSSHPCIVSFYGAFYKDAALSLVLEYMDRGTIADVLAKCVTIPEPVLSQFAKKIVLGLEYLHKEMHIIHRDIKPQNILINSEGEVKITDFGVSGEIAHSNAFANTFTGTLKYMSPERIKGEAHSPKSDIWSLGLVILECYMGHFPYEDEKVQTFFVLLQTIADGDEPQAPNTASLQFSNFISSCLQKEDKKRPESSILSKHPWFITYQDSLTIKEWLEKNYF